MRSFLRHSVALLCCANGSCFSVWTRPGYTLRSSRTRATRWQRDRGASPFTSLQATNGGSPVGIDTEALAEGASMESPPLFNVQAGFDSALDVLGASTQWVVAGSVGTVLLTRADADTLVWVLGSLFNAVFSKVLKKTINQVRPDGSQLKDPGMPSSHAMSLFFLGTYLVIALQQYGVTDSAVPNWPLNPAETQAVIALYAITASLWRVKAGFHTLPQVSVGAVVGSVDAALWYYAARGYVTQQVEDYFGGTEIPVAVTLSICLLTFFTFGNVRRRMGEIWGPQGSADVVEKDL